MSFAVDADTTKAERKIRRTKQEATRTDRNVQKVVTAGFAAMNLALSFAGKTTTGIMSVLRQNVLMAIATYRQIATAGLFTLTGILGIAQISLLVSQLWAMEMGFTDMANQLNDIEGTVTSALFLLQVI